MSNCNIDIRLKRASKEYSEGVSYLFQKKIYLNKIEIFKDVISGDVIITSLNNQAIQHNGIVLTLEGNVNINLSTKSVGLFEAFYNSAKVFK